MSLLEVDARGAVREDADPFTGRWSWRNGAVAGLVATVVTGVAITVSDLVVIRESVAALYGFEGVLVAGWIAHLVHGTLFGVGFAAVLSDPGLYRLSDWLWKTILAGAVYGLVLGVVGAGVIMPIWLSVVGVSSPARVPNVTAPLLLWHLGYGLVLGAVFGVLERRDAPQRRG
ncbi:MAG: histidine kinase [Halosimplex sp.]